MQSTFSKLHAAIIMDGNGRWAQARGLPRIAGHRRGAVALERTVEAAIGLEIGTLTLYAFSADNWKRPVEEVGALMRLFLLMLNRETRRCREQGVRVSVIGRRDRLSPLLRDRIAMAEEETAHGQRIHLRLAVDYSSREAILAAAQAEPGLSQQRLTELLSPSVDLLIRTGGEQRLSDFLLWEAAYAELLFLPVMWPDFDADELRRAVEWFQGRQRRYGGLAPEQKMASSHR
jgi:undecaprenyl diphosphate synthase